VAQVRERLQAGAAAQCGPDANAVPHLRASQDGNSQHEQRQAPGL
jgi:hypothetical protein